MWNEAQRLQKNAGSVFREEEDGAFLFDPEAGNLKYLNRLGAEIYRLLDTFDDMPSLASQMHVRYPDVAPQQIHDDLERFLSDMVANGFIHVQGKGAKGDPGR